MASILHLWVLRCGPTNPAPGDARQPPKFEAAFAEAKLLSGRLKGEHLLADAN